MTTMHDLFGLDMALKSISGMENWDTSSLKDMNSMLYHCGSLESIAFLENWDVSKVTDMHSLFMNDSAVTDFSMLRKWNVSSLLSAVQLFVNIKVHDMSFIADWDLSSLDDAYRMFDSSGIQKIAFNDTFRVPATSNKFHGKILTFAVSSKTISGKESDYTWGLDSENAQMKYTADELTTYAMNNSMAGTWCVQAKPVTTCTVKFDSCGGSGTMADQTFSVGEEKNLAASTFRRAGYHFFGWSTAQSGTRSTSYSDKELVKDLAAAGETVTLYAQWHKLQAVAKVEPSCTEKGREAYYHCSECNKDYADAEGTRVAADLTTLDIPALGHDFGQWQVTKEPTAAEKGEKQRVCSRCGSVEKAEIGLYYFRSRTLRSRALRSRTLKPCPF